MAQLSAETLDELAGFARAGRIGAALPVIRALRAAPRILLGEALSIGWSVEDAAEVVLHLTGPGIAQALPVAAAGERVLPALPLGRYQIALVAANADGIARRSLTVTVAAPPPTLHSALSAAVFEFGAAPIRLSWHSQGAEEVRVEFDGHVTAHAAHGETELAPRRAGRHLVRLTALGAGGAVSVRHAIEAIVPPVHIALHLPQGIGYGAPARVSWTVSGAQAVKLLANDRSFEAVPAQGALAIAAIDQPLDLVLTATGHDGRTHQRRARLAPALLEQLGRASALTSLGARLALAAIRGHGR